MKKLVIGIFLLLCSFNANSEEEIKKPYRKPAITKLDLKLLEEDCADCGVSTKLIKVHAPDTSEGLVLKNKLNNILLNIDKK